MEHENLSDWSKRAADWAAEYHSTIRQRPVRPKVKPGSIVEAIAKSPPTQAESMETIFADFKRIIPDAMTHWQHPRFFAYFSSNAAPASMLAEQLANAISAQCMLWQTSPAATELEMVMMDWIRQALGLSNTFEGVIQDSATSSTLSAVLTMREHALGWAGIRDGLSGQPRLRIYASSQTHSSVDKAVRLAGIGQQNLVKVETDDVWAMCPIALAKSIERDRASGFVPAGVIGCIGGTSIGASDRLASILEIAVSEGIYSHVDAAWAGSAMICPELREVWQGIELADSIVFNPHKWLGANFDCSVQFLKSPRHQIKTLSIEPAYLETYEETEITNYSEWTIPLGRRFRALKLWFLIRAYGLDGLRRRIRNHIEWAGVAAESIGKLEFFEIVTPTLFSLFTFRFCPPGVAPETATKALLQKVNQDGRIYLTQTRHEGKFVIRMMIGQFDTTLEDVQLGVQVIEEIARSLI